MTAATAHGVLPDLAAWCERHLGSPATERFFGHDHLSQAHGLRLVDGREVVLKVRGAMRRLRGCVEVHRALWAEGVPCPRPYAGPLPLSPAEPDRWVTAEEWVPGGEIRLGPRAAEEYAAVLALMVEAAPPVASLPPLDPPVPWLHWDHGDRERVWPPPASVRWDPHRIGAGLPGLVVEVATRARQRLLGADARRLPRVAGHGDFEAHNMRWFADDSQPGGWRPVVHDWDSVVAMPEAVLAGAAAMGYVSPGEMRMARVEDSQRFLDTYAAVRGHVWSAGEVQVAWAAGLWVAAYNAAFEHLKGGPGPVTAELRDQAASRLGRAGA